MFKFVNVNKDFSPHVNDPPPQLIIGNIGSYLWSIGEEMHRWYIKQIQSIVVMVMFSKISQRTSNVVRTSVTHLAATCVSFLVLTTFWHHYSFVSDYNLTTSVVNYWTEAWQHGIYLLVSFNPLERKMGKITEKK